MDRENGQRRYPPELRERALQLVGEIAAKEGNRNRLLSQVAAQLGVRPVMVRKWVWQARHGGQARSPEHARFLALGREIRALRRTNEVLKAACAVFASDLERATLAEMARRTGPREGGDHGGRVRHRNQTAALTQIGQDPLSSRVSGAIAADTGQGRRLRPGGPVAWPT